MGNQEKKTGKKSKWKKRLIIIGCVLAVLLIIGAVAYRILKNYIGDKIVNEMIKVQLNGDLDSGRITIEDLEAIIEDDFYESKEPPEVGEKEPEPSEEKEEILTDSPAEPSAENSEAASEAPTEPSVEKSGEPAKSPSEPSAEKGGEVKGEAEKVQTKPSSDVSPEKRAEVVQKAADKIEESIPRSDKDEIVELIRSRLTASDIARLTELMKGGLANEELGEAVRIAKARFSGEELDKVIDFWHKYQSQVRTYK
ncbi:MAG: hypothetical protein IJO61_08460 [Oscillospiraceae bacterium]|nr:hypothetical protein [Oscillospiraceae bacterium]